jgi:DNA invertase Pin-like site-specific DNA recombinase
MKKKDQRESTASKPTAIQPLRFAPIIRVSTEGQAEKGESLRTQEKQIREYVKKLEGVIPEHCWKYSGQEHATPDQERKKLDTLLQDSAKGLFDAVIVCDASRWSRDNLKSKQGLEILRTNGIRFYIGTQEYSLNSPQHKLFIGMATEINEFVAEEQSRKSLENRIERAKRGIPTAGKYPYGRTFNRTTNQWELDDSNGKVTNIERAAKRYLSGEGLPKIAADLGMNAANLWKILTKLSGDKWQIKFHSEKLNIHETVEMTVPRLLPQETIDAIHEKAKGNKTYNHGEIKHKYLLSRMIFCNHCGYTMFGQKNHSGKRYYRHARQDRRKNGCPSHRMYVPAEDVEKAVLISYLICLVMLTIWRRP